MTESKIGLTKPEVSKLAQDVYAILSDTDIDKSSRMEQAQTLINKYNSYLDPAYPVYSGTLGLEDSDPNIWSFLWIGTFQGETIPNKYTMEIMVYSEPGGKISSLRSRCGVRLEMANESSLTGVVVERHRLQIMDSGKYNPEITTFLGQLRGCIKDGIMKLRDDNHLNSALRQELLLLSDLLETYWSLHSTCDPTGDRIMSHWDQVSQYIDTLLTWDRTESKSADSMWSNLRDQVMHIANAIPDYSRSFRLRCLQSSCTRAKAKVKNLSQPSQGSGLYTQLQAVGRTLSKYPLYSEPRVKLDAELEKLEKVIDEINSALPEQEVINPEWIDIIRTTKI